MTSLLTLEYLGTQILPVLLVAMRLAGLFIAAPMISGTMIPARFKVLLVFMLSLAVFPIVKAESPGHLGAGIVADVWTLVPLILWETAIGFVMGFMVAIPLLALEASGAVAGHQMGLALGRVYNPSADEDADVIGQMLYFAGMVIFCMGGGLDTIVSTMLNSFRNVPVGGFSASMIPSRTVIGLVSSGMELALRVSSPVTAIVMLLSITFGAISKTMPQINVMSVGFSMKAFAGLAVLTFSCYAGHAASSRDIHDAVTVAVEWIQGLIGATNG
jgi:flagellar biosynthetic protein FliR